MFKIGIGYDVHKLVEERKLIIGGVEIEYEKGLLGHSDADVLLHSIMDAILGAIGKGDIGKHFPDNDNAYKDIDSRILLRKVRDILAGENYEISNIDSVIIAQAPKMLSHIEKMKKNISEDLDLDISKINIKATTTEKLGFVGRGEGIACEAVVLCQKQ